MNEHEFEALPHRLGTWSIATRRSQVSTGYRPDFTIHDTARQIVFIIEFETTPSRKTVLGDLAKAERHLSIVGRSAPLLIVLHERSNTTAGQVARHLQPYLEWFRTRRNGQHGVSELLVISDDDYVQSVAAGENLGSPAFRLRCAQVATATPERQVDASQHSAPVLTTNMIP